VTFKTMDFGRNKTAILRLTLNWGAFAWQLALWKSSNCYIL